MQVFLHAWLAAAGASLFCEPLAREPLGFAGAVVAASIAAVLPDLLNKLVVPIWFRPDVTLAGDPLAPDARVIAGGIRKAMRVCLAEGRPLRVLVSRVPGCVVEIGMNAVRRRVFVTVAPVEGGVPVQTSQAALPCFSPGRAAAWHRLTGDGDNLRVRLLPADRPEAGVVCETPVISVRCARICGAVYALGVWGGAGAWTAGAAVVPVLVLRLLYDRGLPRPPAGRRQAFAIVMGSLTVILYNLSRMGLL